MLNPHCFTLICFVLFIEIKNRSECVLKTEEKYWKALTIEHMSEESDDTNDNNVIVIHHLPWRSTGTIYSQQS